MDNFGPRRRLLDELDRVQDARARVHEDDDYRARRDVFRRWQADRLARTHADLLASRRFRDAATFFLNDLYGPQDISHHVENVRRIVPLITKMLPAPAVDTVADAIELDALSEELDAAMVEQIGLEIDRLTPAVYGSAYRAIGHKIERARQIELIAHLGHSLDGLTRQKFIGGALRMMRKPAEVAGLGTLQSFLERGYAAFRTMGGSAEFVDIVVARERALSDALFAGDDAALT